MKRNNGGAGFRQRSDQLVTGKPQAPVKSAASSSSGGVAAKLAASSSQQHHQTTNHSSSSSSSSQSNNDDSSSSKGGMKNNQSWTTKHWLGAVLVPVVFFLSVVSVSNSNRVKSENPCQQTFSKIELDSISAG